ncbi:hypothetical protein SAMD00019534_091300, partial [Acytostelium subglobosum LB1]|uniref:hypothetical protein n=1 Tax=Acytostelium subglobosum LB1 TaxID=1410327 RepID=UPI0006448EF8
MFNISKSFILITVTKGGSSKVMGIFRVLNTEVLSVLFVRLLLFGRPVVGDTDTRDLR